MNKVRTIIATCDSVASIRVMGRSLVALFSLLLAGTVAGVMVFHDMPPPPQKLTGKIMAKLDIPKHAAAEKIPSLEQTMEETASDHLPLPDPPEAEDESFKPKATPTTDAELGLFETTPYGLLPIIRERDKMTPFAAYRAKFTAKPITKGTISLVMADFGLSDTMSKDMTLNLPSGVSFVASPYANNIQQKMTLARSYGHEVWLHIPFEEPNNGINDVGPTSLLSGLRKEQNLLRLKSNLGKTTGYTGVVLPNVAAFATAPDSLDVLFSELAQRGLGFVQTDSRDTTSIPLAAAKNIPHAQSQTWIDASYNPADMKLALSQLEDIALKGQNVVAMFHPAPAIIPLIGEWVKTLPLKNIELAPLSTGTEQPAKK